MLEGSVTLVSLQANAIKLEALWTHLYHEDAVMKQLQQDALKAAYNAFIARNALNRGEEAESRPGHDNLLHMTMQQVRHACIAAGVPCVCSSGCPAAKVPSGIRCSAVVAHELKLCSALVSFVYICWSHEVQCAGDSKVQWAVSVKFPMTNIERLICISGKLAVAPLTVDSKTAGLPVMRNFCQSSASWL